MRSSMWRPVTLCALVVALQAPASLAAEPASPKGSPKYKIAMAVMADAKWDAIRYDAASGKAWHIVSGKWLPIKEVSDPPVSRYKIHIVPLKDDWGALRVDLRSGRSWAATPSGWSEISEQK